MERKNMRGRLFYIIASSDPNLLLVQIRFSPTHFFNTKYTCFNSILFVCVQAYTQDFGWAGVVLPRIWTFHFPKFSVKQNKKTLFAYIILLILCNNYVPLSQHLDHFQHEK